MGRIRLKHRLIFNGILPPKKATWLFLLLMAIGVICILLILKNKFGSSKTTHVEAMEKYKAIRGADEPKRVSSKIVGGQTKIINKRNKEWQKNLRLAIDRAREAVKRRRMSLQ